MNKRLLVFLMILSLLVLPVMEAFAAGGSVRYITSPNGGKVNVRHGPNEKGYAVAAQLPVGTEVKLISSRKGWSEIVYNGFTVYVMSKYLSSSKPGSGSSKSASAVASPARIRYITSGNGKKVNVRTGPGEKGYAIAAQLPVGTEVNLISSKKGWSKIQYNGFTLYVMSKYLSGSKPGSGKSGSSKFASFTGKLYSANGHSVNMRVKPDKKSDLIAQLPVWTKVEVIGQSGSWYKVSYGISTGYILKRYVR